ncbi:MAG TPA: hypothetical protein VGR76_10300 [Candidatus Angelobacter sp.]|nr:hypothetical protein [Candidatus Angelobacter sp.]
MLKIVTEVMPVGSVPEADAKLFCEWMWKQKEKTQFDPEVLNGPRSCLVKVKRGENTLALVPIHPVIFIESLCSDPNATKSELVLAMFQIQEQVKAIMRHTAHTEAYFVTTFKDFADLSENHGWTKYLFDEKKNSWLMKLQVKQEIYENPA